MAPEGNDVVRCRFLTLDTQRIALRAVQEGGHISVHIDTELPEGFQWLYVEVYNITDEGALTLMEFANVNAEQLS